MFVFLTSCKGQNKTDFPKEKINSETRDASTSRWIYTKYEYTDSVGKSLFVQNSFPKGGTKYTDHNGDVYGYAVFWTQIINETDNPLELMMDFPVNSYEVPYLPGKYYKVLIPSDTMTLDKSLLFNYGLIDKESFLDKNIHKPSFLKRIINPHESSAFFVVILSLVTEGGSGILRTGLSIKGQNLFYRISRYKSAPGLPLMDEKEINCGSINLKNLVLKQ